MTSIDKKEIEWTRNQAANYNGVDIAKDRKTRRVTNFAKQNKEKALSNNLQNTSLRTILHSLTLHGIHQEGTQT